MIPFPDKKYSVIYADPAWSYENKKTGGSMKSGAEHVYGSVGKYDVMSLEEICQLPVPAISKPDSVLFLWATVPLMPEAFEVMKAWGFEYKTMITWYKDQKKLGMGFWLRVQTEHLLVGIKGNVPAFHSHKRNMISAPVQEHSKKPSIFRRLVEELTVKMEPRIELFARGAPAFSWDAWGNEVESTPILEQYSL